MKRIIVPAAAGVFSALGLLLADMQMRTSSSFQRRLAQTPAADLQAAFAALEQRFADELAADLATEPAYAWHADLRYAGQAFELTVPVARGPLDDDRLRELGEAFNQEHERTYGHRHTFEAIELVVLRVVASVPATAGASAGPMRFGSRAARTKSADRTAWFGSAGAIGTPVIDRGALASGWSAGPLIVEEYEGTTVVPPDARVRLDDRSNIVMELLS